MKLLSLNKLFSFLIFILITTFSLEAEEAIDIWKKDVSNQDEKEIIKENNPKKNLEKVIHTIQEEYSSEKNRKNIDRKTCKRLWRRANRCREKFNADKDRQWKEDDAAQRHEIEYRRAEKRRRQEANSLLGLELRKREAAPGGG